MDIQDEYIAASNNSMNDNKVNSKLAQRGSNLRHIKRILKPIFAFMGKGRTRTYRKNDQPDYQDEINDNKINEMREQNQEYRKIGDIIDDLYNLSYYDCQGMGDIVPIFRNEKYIPVHFAKTEAGTFFWSNMVCADCDIQMDGDIFTEKQAPQVQVPCDRWAQAWRCSSVPKCLAV